MRKGKRRQMFTGKGVVFTRCSVTVVYPCLLGTTPTLRYRHVLVTNLLSSVMVTPSFLVRGNPVVSVSVWLPTVGDSWHTPSFVSERGVPWQSFFEERNLSVVPLLPSSDPDRLRSLRGSLGTTRWSIRSPVFYLYIFNHPRFLSFLLGVSVNFFTVDPFFWPRGDYFPRFALMLLFRRKDVVVYSRRPSGSFDFYTSRWNCLYLYHPWTSGPSHRHVEVSKCIPVKVSFEYMYNDEGVNRRTPLPESEWLLRKCSFP